MAVQIHWAPRERNATKRCLEPSLMFSQISNHSSCIRVLASPGDTAYRAGRVGVGLSTQVANRTLNATTIVMPSEATLNLSILELLQALNEKLSLECTGIQGKCFPPILGPISSVEAEASRRQSIHLHEHASGS